MRRALLIFLMWLIPFQAVWSVGHTLHEQLENMAVHSHSHDHDGADLAHLFSDPLSSHDDDGRHGCHGHASFSFMVADIGLGLNSAPAAEPPQTPPASFTSHIPLLPDPPPAVRI
jgi:hypothetical protein